MLELKSQLNFCYYSKANTTPWIEHLLYSASKGRRSEKQPALERQVYQVGVALAADTTSIPSCMWRVGCAPDPMCTRSDVPSLPQFRNLKRAHPPTHSCSINKQGHITCMHWITPNTQEHTLHACIEAPLGEPHWEGSPFRFTATSNTPNSSFNRKHFVVNYHKPHEIFRKIFEDNIFY